MASTRVPLNTRPRFLRALVLAGALAVVLLPGLSRAQKVTTDIALPASGSPGSLKTKVDLIVDQKGISTYTITEGTRSGFNLFHSFLRFTVGQNAGGQNDIANFSNIFNGQPGPLTNNIVSRVTGGVTSNIFGTITTTGFGGANLFLINPAGVVFGPSATLSIGGAFYVSTADYLRFKDKNGPTFSARVVGNEVLSADSPFAFGFLGPLPPQTIAVNGSKLSVGTEQSFSIVGGDIQIAGPGTPASPNLRAPSGQIQLVSVASKGEVSLKSPDGAAASFQRLGQINLSKGAFLDVSGSPAAGTVVIRGGRLVMDGGAGIQAQTRGSGAGGGVKITAGSMEMRESASIQSGTVCCDGSFQGTGSGGDISIGVETLTLTGNFTRISTLSSGPAGSGGAGPGGKLEVDASSSITISGQGSGLLSTTSSQAVTGIGGPVMVSARSLTIQNGATIQSLSSGPARGGDIAVVVGDLSLTGGATINSNTTNFTTGGPGGNVTVTATDSALISGSGSGIRSSSQRGPTGAIVANFGQLTLNGGGVIQSGSTIATTENPGGRVEVNATGSIVISGGSKIASQTFSRDVGQVSVSAQSLLLDNGLIRTTTTGPGRAGEISLNVGQLTLTRGGRIESDTTASGHGGNIEIHAGRVQLADRATISATSSKTGDAGNISIAARDVTLRDSAVTTDARTADGGNVDITGRSLVYLLDSRITTSVGSGKGRGGNITMDPQFVVLDHSQIRADAFGGPGGHLNILSDFFLTNASLLSASSALSTQGTIEVQSRFTNVSSSVAPLPAGLAQAATLLRASCAARVAAGKASSLAVTGRERVPLEPGGYLPSPLIAVEPGGLDRSERGSEAPDRETLPRLSLSVFSSACSR